MPEVRVPRGTGAVGDGEPPQLPASRDAPLLAAALARSFELVAGIALFALIATAVVVVLVPSSSAARVGFAVELVAVGLALVVLALLLSRRSARSVMEPLEVLDAALVAITAGDLTVRVRLDQAAVEIQSVGESVNTMVRELARLRVVETERNKDLRFRRELSDAVHASLDRDHVVQRAVEVVGEALDVDRVHIRLRDADSVRLVAEWRRADDVVSIPPVAPFDELAPLVQVIGVTDDLSAEVIDDARAVARFSADQRQAFEALAIRAAVKYPIVVGAQAAGVLVASEASRPREWSESEVTLMEGFALEIGRALDHARAFQLQNEMVERLGVLDRSKNDFLAEVSRELRGPLASVLGYIELLTDESAEAVSDEQRRMLRIVERNGEQLLVRLADLLTMSRIEAGEFEPKLARVDIDGLARRVCAAIAPAVAAGGLVLDAEVAPAIELYADERQVERALTNLLSNAVKYTPAGGRIELSVRADGSDVVVQVRDTGVGIAASDQRDLFTRFFSASGVRRRASMGSGLGLYIVDQIVKGHGGRVEVDSAPGQGSTFSLRFPSRPLAFARRASDRNGVRAAPADLVAT